MAMIVSSMTDTIIGPEAMAAYAINCGARVNGGTDVTTLADNICKDYGLTYETTSDENQLLEHLRSGGLAIGNVGGNRDGWMGVFSSAGHFIVISSCSGNTVLVCDPDLYPGKFNINGRAGKVAVDGDYCYCDISILTNDTANRSPAYWLFKKGEEGKGMPEGAASARLTINGKEYPAYILGGHVYFGQGVQISDFISSLNRTWNWSSENLTLEIK